MIIDCRDWKTHADRARDTRRVFVDGVEIKGVWYVDTDLGIVKTYEILQDASDEVLKAFAGSHVAVADADLRSLKIAARTFSIIETNTLNALPAAWELEYDDPDQPVSRTIRGKVELQPLSEAERTEAGIIDDGR